MAEDIAELGLRVDSRQVQQADGALDEFQRTATTTSQKVGLLTNALKLMAAAFAALKLAKLIEETALLNARFETMGVVMNVAGNNAGYTSSQMAELEKELTKTGISMIKARENLTSLATANIDLSKATKLARAAQDLAVVGNINSSEAFSRLTQGIKSGEVEVLRTLGLNVNFENSYKKLASQLGTTSEKLTEQQKIQARVNVTLEQASRYSGIYEESLGTAGKQLQSLSRYLEDAKVKVGAVFNKTLTAIVGDFTEALKAANAELDKAGQSGQTGWVGEILAKGFKIASQTVLVLGANVLYVLKVIGNEIGAFGAALAQVFIAPLRALNGLGAALDLALSGKFSQAAEKASQAFTELGNGVRNVKMISEESGKANDAAAAALAAYEQKIMGSTAAVETDTEAQKANAAVKEQARIAAGIAARAQEEADAKALAAREAAAKAFKKLQEDAASFYKTQSENAKDQIAILQAEINGTEELTAAQKKHIEVLNELDRVRKGLKKGQAAQIEADADAVLWLDNLNEAIKKNKKARDDQIAAGQKDIDAAIEATNALQDQITYYGMTTDAVLKLKAAEMDREIALAQSNGDEIKVATLQVLQSETIKQADLQRKLNEMKSATDFWTGLEQAAHQTFLSISNGNKDLWTRLKDTAKNVFFEWLYQQTLKKWIINIGMQSGGTSAVSGIANAVGGSGNGAGGFGSVAGIYNMAKSAYSAFAGGFETIATTVADGTQAALYGSGLSSNIASNGAFATGVGSVASAGAGIFGGLAVGKGISGGYGSNSAVNAGTAIGAVVGSIIPVLGTALGALIGGAIGGIWNRTFGMGAKKITGTTLEGTLTPSGATGNTIDSWTQKGGWFRSDKSGKTPTAFSAEFSNALTDTYKGILDVTKVLGDTIGADTSALSTRVQKLSIDLTGLTTDAERADAVTKFFAGVADTISTELVPNLAHFQVEGEALSATLQRVATDYASVDVILGSINKTFGAVGVSSIAAREALISAAGGMDKLASGVSYFQQNFLTDAQKLAPVQKQVSDALAAVGQSGLKTIEQYKAYTLAIDTSTEAGAKLFAQMIALAPAFKQVADAAKAAEDAAAAAAEKAKAEADAAIAAAKEAANATLAAQQQAQKDYVQSIGNALVEGMQRAAEAAKELQSSLDSLLTGGLSPLSDQAKYEAAKAAFQRASTNDPAAYSAAGNALLQASQSLYGAGSYGYALDYSAIVNGLQGGIASNLYTASGVGQRDFLNTVNNSMNGSTASNDDVVAAVNTLKTAITPILEKISTSTTTQADLTDQVTQGGRATRTTTD